MIIKTIFLLGAIVLAISRIIVSDSADYVWGILIGLSFCLFMWELSEHKREKREKQKGGNKHEAE